MITLEKKSGIWIAKSKFFFYRALIYFSFLLFPVWIPKGVGLNPVSVCVLMVAYILFMVAQWFLLGKEIDHRLKIYFRVNSSIDRVVYRILLGMFFVILYFTLLSFLPPKWIYNCFWITWALLGLFYSWPTRGKIIQESMSSNLAEFRFLDSFEKTLLGLIIVMFVVSLPPFPLLESTEALKLFFDPGEKFSTQFWDFMTVNYYPFKRYPALLRVAWSMHFYVVGAGLFLVTFYAFLRYFVSRRLSMLGTFAIVSAWSWVKILEQNCANALTMTYSLTWMWTFLWVARSSTYRAGLFMGLVGYWGVLLHRDLMLLLPIQLLLLYFFFLEDKTPWFKRQLLKYASFGLCMAILAYLMRSESWGGVLDLGQGFFQATFSPVLRKAFFSLSYLGLLVYLGMVLLPDARPFKSVQMDVGKLKQLGVGLLVLALYGLTTEITLVSSFSLMWVVALLSLFPIEMIFQVINRLRSKRNIIYVAYIIICLLDSHFEGRVKNIAQMLN